MKIHRNKHLLNYKTLDTFTQNKKANIYIYIYIYMYNGFKLYMKHD